MFLKIHHPEQPSGLVLRVRTDRVAEAIPCVIDDGISGELASAIRAGADLERRVDHAHGFLRELQCWTDGQVLLSLAVKFFVAREDVATAPSGSRRCGPLLTFGDGGKDEP